MNKDQKIELIELLSEQEKRIRYNYANTLFPEEGPYRRELYPKHIAFMNGGATNRQRLFMAANQVGKTLTGALEVSYHLTGKYPHWWEGRRFKKPVHFWCAGLTAEMTKKVSQLALVGPLNDIGSGTLPKVDIVEVIRKPGVPEACLEVRVRHISGGISTAYFKAYDQDRTSFQGGHPDGIWLDEEPPSQHFGIYTECLTRTVTNNGIVLCTFTPLFGLTELVLKFLPEGQVPPSGIKEKDGKLLVNVLWDDVPHLTEEAKADLLKEFTPFERDARTKGYPFSGVGLIYPVHEEEVAVTPFDIPDHWERAYGFDPGTSMSANAVVWGARDPNTGVIYLYEEYMKNRAEPSIVADGIKFKGSWIPGVVDPKEATRLQYDQRRLMEIYSDHGLDLSPAQNAVEAGISLCWQGLSSGKIKVFRTMSRFFQEMRMYRRDEKNEIIKKNDHLMDAFRYLMMSGMDRAVSKLDALGDEDDMPYYNNHRSYGASEVTGY